MKGSLRKLKIGQICGFTVNNADHASEIIQRIGLTGCGIGINQSTLKK